jgi:hypothetical protein
MQTCIGVELSSPMCLIRYHLFYRREILLLSGMWCVCTSGGHCVVGWCLDNPCGGSITGSLVWHLSFCSRSQYQCGAILPADVCVDVDCKCLWREIKIVYLHVV